MSTTDYNEIFNDLQDIHEALNFPARLLSTLPFPPNVVLYVVDFGTVIFNFGRSSSQRQIEKYPVFDVEEISLLIKSVESDCCGMRRFFRILQRKVVDPFWRFDRQTAFAGDSNLISSPPKPKNWTLGRVLKALGAELRMIRIDGSQPTKQNAEASK